MSAGRTIGRRTFRAVFGPRSPALVALALLALLVQNLVPISLAMAAPTTPFEAAFELHATFGDAVQVCAHVDDEQPSPAHSKCVGDGCCPLCGGGSAQAALEPPASAALPVRRELAISVVRPAPSWQRSARPRASPAQPRGPPFEV